MCGIAGIIGPSVNRERRTQQINAMLSAIERRGPDASGTLHEGPVTFGHRRLSILDTSERGKQPMSIDGGRYIVSYNGEIYNFRSLVRLLEDDGCKFQSTGDTELILYAFRKWGRDCFSKFNGMFAIALYDRETRRLTLVRDRFGKKPLHYYEKNNELLFSSTLSGIIPGMHERPELSTEATLDYLAGGYPLLDRSMVKDVQKLQPGVVLEYEVSDNGLTRTYSGSFYNLDEEFLSSSETSKSDSESLSEFISVLDRSVEDRLISDRPVGLFLSGGMDSSLISAFAQKHYKVEKFHAFTCAFREEDFSEHLIAKKTAKHLGLEHHIEFFPEPDLDDLVGAISRLGEPLGDSSYLPMEFLCSKAKNHVDVVLSGDGADELLGGYETYKASNLAGNPLLRSAIARGLLSSIALLAPVDQGKVSLSYKLKAFAEGLKYPFPVSHYSWRILAELGVRASLINPDYLKEIKTDNPEKDISKVGAEMQSGTTLRQAQYLDYRTWLASDILSKVDYSSMAHGLEMRCPFLDPRLLTLSLKLPQHLVRKGSMGKVILRQAAERLIPKEVLAGPKRGFNAPVNVWLSGPLKNQAQEILSEASQITDGMLCSKQLLAIFAEHTSKKRDRGFLLWSVLVYLVWLSEHWRNKKGLVKC